MLRSLDLLVFSRNGISFLRFLFVSPSSRQLCHTSLASLAMVLPSSGECRTAQRRNRKAVQGLVDPRFTFSALA